MVLRDYQEEAVRKAVERIAIGKKLRIELSAGLGRRAIIARIANHYANKGEKVLVLSPNKSTCIQLENLIEEERPSAESLRIFDRAEYSEPMITTFTDDRMQYDINDFYLIICDGIHFGNLDKRIRNGSNLCVLGFTSKMEEPTGGYFSNSECIFSLSLQDVLDRYDTCGFEFEKIVYDTYKMQGYGVSGIEEENNGFGSSADKDSEHLIIVIKYWSSQKIANDTLIEIVRGLKSLSHDSRKIVLVTNSIVDEEQRVKICNGIEVVDFHDLLSLSKTNRHIENMLKKISSFVADEGDAGSTNPFKRTIEELIEKYENWDPQNTLFTEYEDLS